MHRTMCHRKALPSTSKTAILGAEFPGARASAWPTSRTAALYTRLRKFLTFTTSILQKLRKSWEPISSLAASSIALRSSPRAEKK
eukprot:scaffold480_cov257-Pinguiococcus_pyrenoidosus.AAC.20